MIYSKLPVVLLSMMMSLKKGSTNEVIGQYILSHVEEVKEMGIEELAHEVHVANSSISRFCKEVGLSSFNELKQIIHEGEFHFEISSNYEKDVISSIQRVEKSINKVQLYKLCEDIYHYQNVGLFGLLKAETAAINLQSDLMMMKKMTYTNVAYDKQMDYILQSHEDDLIIIFTYTGTYFDEKSLRNKISQLNKPRIWYITAQCESYPSYVNEVLDFSSKKDQVSHPYQLDYVAGLIAQCYAKRKGVYDE